MVSRPAHPVGDEEAEAEDEGTEQGNSSDNPQSYIRQLVEGSSSSQGANQAKAKKSDKVNDQAFKVEHEKKTTSRACKY